MVAVVQFLGVGRELGFETMKRGIEALFKLDEGSFTKCSDADYELNHRLQHFPWTLRSSLAFNWRTYDSSRVSFKGCCRSSKARIDGSRHICTNDSYLIV